MDDPLCRKIVERLAIAGAGPGRVSALDRRRMRRWVRQGLGGEQIAAAARPARVPTAPDFGGPVGGTPRPVDQGLRCYHHRRADRLETEFLSAPPAHTDRLARFLNSNDRRVGCRVVRAVMAIAART